MERDVQNKRKANKRMTIKKSDVSDLLERLAKKYSLPVEDLLAEAGEMVVYAPKKSSTYFASRVARDAAEEAGLKETDWSPTERTGSPRKNGTKTITLKDVKDRIKTIVTKPTTEEVRAFVAKKKTIKKVVEESADESEASDDE